MYKNSYRSRSPYYGNASHYSNNGANRFALGRSSSYGRPAPKNGIHESKYIKRANGQSYPEVYVPQTKFMDLPIHAMLKTNITRRGFITPTPIQDKAIPHILVGKDLIGIANTGTGKTGAFLIPLIEKFMKNSSEKAIIIVPTRELAQQIRQDLRLFSLGMPIYASLCIGGASMGMQISELRRNPHFVIGTPGRLKDLIKRNVLKLAMFNTIVLDEVDRMVDMGFIQDIKFLISLLPEKRQSLFFSATISPQINTIIQSFLRDPITVSVRSQETAENVNQDVVRVKQGSYKIEVLEGLLKKEEFKKVLIFGRTKLGVEKLSTMLYQKGFKVASIHGDKPQFKRQQAIRMFKENVVSILVATDVAARGLDIPNITHVINYDQPATYDDYIHRIGRTGRANQKGSALTFV